MSAFDAVSGISIVTTNVNDVKTGDETGDTVDGRGFESILHIVVFGAEGDTLSGSVYMDLILEDSSNDSDWTVVTSSDAVNINSGSYDGVVVNPDSSGIFATIDAAAEADKVYAIGYRGTKRYSRVRNDLTGSHSSGTPTAMMALRMRPAVAPV